jgi:hypothetical protein
MNGERQQKYLEVFRGGRKSIKHGGEFLNLRRICLGRRKISEGNTMQWKDGQNIFIPGEENDTAARIVWHCYVSSDSQEMMS